MVNLVITKVEKLIVFFLSIWIFLIFRNKIVGLDNSIYWFLNSFENDLLTIIVKLITCLGSAYVLVFISAISLFFIKKNGNYKYISINLILVFLLNQFLKRIFRRNRPLFIHLVKENGFSFPSGHAMVSFCFYGLLIYYIHKSDLKYKKVYEALLSFLIVLIGLSRIYLGVHYFSDIIGGFIFGLLYLLIFIRLFKLK